MVKKKGSRKKSAFRIAARKKKRSAVRKRQATRKSATKISRARRARALPRKAARDLARAAAVCHLKPGQFDVAGASGSHVTLAAKPKGGGSVDFLTATYGGKNLMSTKSTSKIEFDIAKGRKILQMTFGFSGGTGGRGELIEDCGAGASQALRPLAGHEPEQFLEVIGT